MRETINWIHISDLHLGLDARSWLWPRIKHDFLEDLERLGEEVDNWDLVFFTGDLTQSGDPQEFARLNTELEEIWNVLSKKGKRPLLCAIPGNHDLRRPQHGSAIERTLTQLWWSDQQLRRAFWEEDRGEYRDAVSRFFLSYVEWSDRVSVPAISKATGLIPGDFSASFSKGDVRLGIVGLNSTFLQVAKGDFKKRLDLHVSQLNAVCGGDPVRWLSSHTASVLMTHQPPSWLSDEAYDHFRQEIYPPGRFVVHLCGHQHEPEASDLSEAGAAPRRLRQAPSLFGLEEWEGGTPKQRIHGYTAGQFVFEDSTNAIEKLWPRIAMKGRHGGLNLCPDHTYQLQEGNCIVTPFGLNPVAPPGRDPDPPQTGAEGSAESQSQEVQLFEGIVDLETARRRLASCPRLNLPSGAQHQFVRQEEQSQFELAIRSSRSVWLIADWGIGKEGFLGASLSRFARSDGQITAFHLRCDEALDVDAIEALFPQQFGMSLQGFCNLAAPLETSFIVFDEIQSGICSGENLSRLRQLISAMLDYSPTLSVVFVSRLAPEHDIAVQIRLNPLEAPDVRTYISHHPDATPDLGDAETIEKLFARSDGLPMHLDRMLRALKVMSLPAVLDKAIDSDSASLELLGTTPRALATAVSTLARSRDKRTKRSFRLLKVLCVLSYGETLDALNHYLPTEPFFFDNALQLHDLGLLDVILLQNAGADFSNARWSEADTPKVLKIPRQVRDYVNTLVNDNERTAILLAGMDTFFGRRWREGIVKLRKVSASYRDYLSSGVGNEFVVIRQLLKDGGRTAEPGSTMFDRTLDAGLEYVRHLRNAERFRDLSLVAGSLAHVTDQNSRPAAWAEFTALSGIGLRMIGKFKEGVEYLHQALDEADLCFAEKDKADLWMNIAMTQKTLKNVEAAVSAANRSKEHAKGKEPGCLEADFVIFSLTLVGDEKIEALKRLEARARRNGFLTTADTIALELAQSLTDMAEKLSYCDRVLDSKKQGYNQARAIIDKAHSYGDADENIKSKLGSIDIMRLASAYSYVHAQRFSGLFDRCHEALWRVFESRGDIIYLLRLFRHSSFVWRVRGEESRERESAMRLVQKPVPLSEARPNTLSFDLETQYFWRRFKTLDIKNLLATKQSA